MCNFGIISHKVTLKDKMQQKLCHRGIPSFQFVQQILLCNSPSEYNGQQERTDTTTIPLSALFTHIVHEST